MLEDAILKKIKQGGREKEELCFILCFNMNSQYEKIFNY